VKIGIDLIDKHINGYKVRVQHLKLRNCDFMMTEDSQIQQLIDHFSQLTLHELNKQFGLAKRHGVNSLFVMALDDVMCEIRASFSELKETVISIYRTMLQEFFKTEVAALEQSDNPWEGFVEWARKGNKANYDNEYFQVVEVEQETGCFGFDIQKCLYFDILRESGKPELGPILCDYDNILAGAIENWIVFTRHETIASGDKRCTFRYCKQ
jgi:hypothetical protein